MGKLPIESLDYTRRQREAMRLLTNKKYKFVQFYGGSRSGKTALIVEAILILCLKYAGSKHLIARYSLANARKTIWKQTIMPMIKRYESHGICEINKTNATIDFYNGSMIQLGGLQPDQIDAVLGSEFGTIFVNEANENPWSSIELLFSRLNDIAEDENGHRITPRFIADLNPTSFSSWDYQFFHLKKNPETGKEHAQADRIAHIKLNPKDNEENLSEDYIDTLEGFSATKKKRFFHGDYGNYSGLIYELPPAQRSIDFNTPNYTLHLLGIDFGHRHATCFSTIRSNGERFLIWDEYYKKGMTASTIIKKAVELYEQYSYDYIFCDGSRSEIIEELVDAGIPAEKAIKGDGSVFTGIMHMKGLIEEGNLYVHGSNCPMHLAEFDSYRWMESSTSRKEKPVKEDDDCMDASRYAIHSYKLKMGLTAPSDKLLDFQNSIN